MVKSVEATGKTIEIAIDNAYALLGEDRDAVEATVEVVDRPKNGFLGIGSAPAKVRISIEVPDPEPTRERPKAAHKPAQDKPRERTAPVEQKPARRPEQNRRPADKRPEPRTQEPFSAQVKRDPADQEKAIATATAFLTGLLERMGASARPEMKFNDEGILEIELVGEELGMLIGRRGDTLNAIQHITSHVVNKERSDRVRVTVDVENYRTKREETLCKLAHKTALKVVRYRRNISLEPMNAYERHVIHTALQDWRDVSTFSSGAEPRRCVVISYTPGGGAGAGQHSRRAPAEGIENAEVIGENANTDRAPREYRGGNRRGGRGGNRRDGGGRGEKQPQAERPKPQPLEEQIWE